MNEINKEQFLRELLTHIAGSSYKASILSKYKYIENEYILLRKGVSDATKPLVDAFLKKYKNVSKETLLKFLTEGKYPEKYKKDLDVILNTTYKTIESKVTNIPCFNALETRKMSMGVVSILERHNLLDKRYFSFLPFFKIKYTKI